MSNISDRVRLERHKWRNNEKKKRFIETFITDAYVTSALNICNYKFENAISERNVIPL